jgi:hypothetical protein
LGSAAGVGLRPDITVDDIAMFVREAVAADREESRAQAIGILLAGVIYPVEHNTVDSGQT